MRDHMRFVLDFHAGSISESNELYRSIFALFEF